MRISDWSSDVCSSDLWVVSHGNQRVGKRAHPFVFFSERHYRGENQRMPLFAKLSGCISRASARLSACVVLLACLLSGAVIAAATAPVAEGDGYRYYAIGELGRAACRERVVQYV